MFTSGPSEYQQEYSSQPRTRISGFRDALIHRQGPWRSVAQGELATARWVAWWNRERLHAACDDVPPAEFETAYWQRQGGAYHRCLNPSPRVSTKLRAIQGALRGGQHVAGRVADQDGGVEGRRAGCPTFLIERIDAVAGVAVGGVRPAAVDLVGPVAGGLQLHRI